MKMMGTKGKISMWKTTKERTRLKFLGLGGIKWKRLNFKKMSFLENLRYKIMSIIEAMVLVSKLAFFFLCCGCRF
ncbi:PREDICTED: uncharacterized protein LOC104771893 [Camelina sativa]|uniref:Uncharacterized protein LOC104760268 n=1 Tax=Camelina sativa TaxID=90675 RepID=A0ABM0Y3B3_CAMSA|nr:PREDICTED: uncharacterized protein LOC104760268 [Camelina sativa]XP_010494800.1 PREDICTED: uncharacterized protein LOC104771893 [Camelina sativa]